jgi:thioredoxin reductase
VKDLLIIGAGPAGLAVAIVAHRAGLRYEVLEKGALVNSVFRFPKGMIFFTTPELLEIGGLPFVTPYEKPTRGEALKYYRRVADTYGLAIRLGEEALSLSAEDEGTVLAVRTRSLRREATWKARAVVVATGYYDHPNTLGVPGEDLPHVAHYYDEPHAFFRKRVVVVGGKNSAAIAALELFRAGAQVTLVNRREQLGAAVKYWIRPDIENRIKDPHRLPPGCRAAPAGRRPRRRDDAQARARPCDPRDPCARDLRGGCARLRARDQPHLHRERPLPWGGDRRRRARAAGAARPAGVALPLPGRGRARAFKSL